LDKNLTSKKITDIAASQNKKVENAIIDLLIASEGRVITSMEILSRENVKKAILHPLSIISTNGDGYNLNHVKTGEKVHSRSFGTFPKFLKEYVLDNNFLSMEEAIRKITSYPAERFGLEKRGKIAKGYGADILVFDSGKIDAPSSKENPYQYSCGMENILINGKIILKDGQYQGIRNGRVIKKM
jgi:N-acyl-D-amino-acid deacylase